MAAGAGAAYRGYQKLDNGISESLQRLTGIKAQENAAEKTATEREGVRVKASSDAYALKFNDEDLTFEMGNNPDYVSKATHFVGLTRDQARGFKDLALEAEKVGNFKEARLYENKYNNSKNSIKEMASLKPIVEAMSVEYLKNKDKLLAEDPRTKISNSFIKENYLIKPTEDGKMTIIVGMDKDNSGDISEEEQEAGDKYLRDGYQTKGFEFKEIKPSELVKGGYSVFNKVPIMEKGGLLDQVTSNVGLTVQDTKSKNGDFMVTTTSLDEKGLAALGRQIDLELAKPETFANVMVLTGNLDKNGYLKPSSEYTKADRENARADLLKMAEAKYGFKQSINTIDATRSDKRNPNTKPPSDKDKFSMDRVFYQSPNVKNAPIDTKNAKPNAAQFAIEDNFKVQEIIPPETVLTEAQIVERKYTTIVVTDKGELFLRSLNKDVKDLQIDSDQKTFISKKLNLGSGDDLLALAKQGGSAGSTAAPIDTSRHNKK